MRVIGTSMAVVVSLVGSMQAQQAPNSPVSVERVRLALDKHQPTLIVPTQPWTGPTPRRLGVLTLIPPASAGQFVNVSIPAGALATRVTHAVSSAQHRRAERKAGARVERDLHDFEAQLPREK